MEGATSCARCDPCGERDIAKSLVEYIRVDGQVSARARPGMGVSIPVSWNQLPTLKSGAQWTVATAREYLSFEKTDPWADFAKSRQTLTVARKKLKLP